MSRPVVLRVVVVARRCVGGIEIDFEFAFGPENDFEDGVVSGKVVDLGIAALAGGEIQFGAISSLLNNQAAGFLPHFEGLQ